MDQHNPLYASEQFKKRRDELFVERLTHILGEFSFDQNYSSRSLAKFTLASINNLNQITDTFQTKVKLQANQEPEQDKVPWDFPRNMPRPKPLRDFTDVKEDRSDPLSSDCINV